MKKKFYISVDGDIFEITYDDNLHNYKDVVRMIDHAIDNYKTDHDMWTWEEGILDKFDAIELGNLPHGEKIAFRRSLDPAIDNDDDDIMSEDDDFDKEDYDEPDEDVGDTTDW